MLKESVKALRAWRPVNGPTTIATRALSRLSGREFESAIKHLPRSGPVRAKLPNGEVLRLWSRGDDWVSNQVFWRGWSGFEPETAPLFFRLAQDAQVVLDVGAYVGYYTVLAALANRRSRIFAFEPMPDNAERLLHHLELNQIDNADLVTAAVSETEGRAELFHLEGDFQCSTSLVREFISSHPHFESTTVPTVALDTFLQERGPGQISLVKIDIETAEPDALRGMQETLERDHPTIVCEVLSDEVGAQLQGLLGPLGYRFHHLTGAGPTQRPEIDAHPEWTNWLFTAMPHEQLDGQAYEVRRSA